jgi:hypothetical protein
MDRNVAIMLHRSARMSARLRWASTIAVTVAVAALVAAWSGRAPAADPAYVQDERNYAVFDALFLQRNNATVKQPLIVDQDAPTVPLISTGDLTSTIGTGARLLYGNYGENDIGWEVGYLGVYGMEADAGVTSSGTLRLPGGLGQLAGSGFDDADAVAASTRSSLCSVEVNFFDFWSDGGRDRSSPYPWRRCHNLTTHDWLLGVRWAWLGESAALDVTTQAGDPASPYRVQADTNWIGPQIGYRRRTEWQAWAFEGWAKATLAGTVASQSQGPVVGPLDGVEVRGPTSDACGGLGMISDLNFTLVRNLGDVWAVRLGYNLLWLTNAAQAANQWNLGPAAGIRTGVVDGSAVFLHGATAGLEARW